MAKRSDWTYRLPQPLIIPGVMTLRTLADVRKLLGHLPKDFRARSTWQRIAALLDDAARGGASPNDVAVALQLVLMLEKVMFKAEMNARSYSPVNPG
jgi:hypothetical protein